MKLTKENLDAVDYNSIAIFRKGVLFDLIEKTNFDLELKYHCYYSIGTDETLSSEQIIKHFNYDNCTIYNANLIKEPK